MGYVGFGGFILTVKTNKPKPIIADITCKTMFNIPNPPLIPNMRSKRCDINYISFLGVTYPTIPTFPRNLT